MRRIALLILAMVAFAPRLAHAQAQTNSFDPCAQLPKSSAAINISSATDTQLVALQANTPIYVCGVTLNQVDGTGSSQFEYGTGSNCATGQTALTGPIYASTVANKVTNSTVQPNAFSGSQLAVPAGNALCIKSTGTIQQSGWVTYVQSANTNVANFFDPCNVYPKSSASINMSSATTTKIISNGGSTAQTYICSVVLEDAGRATTANTTTFVTGTGTNCGTGQASISGPITGTLTAGDASNIGLTGVEASGTDLLAGAGLDVCVTTTQSSTVTGWVTFVQR